MDEYQRFRGGPVRGQHGRTETSLEDPCRAHSRDPQGNSQRISIFAAFFPFDFIHGPLKLAGGGGVLGLNRPKLPLIYRTLGQKIGRPPKSGGPNSPPQAHVCLIL